MCDVKREWVSMPTLASHNLFGNEIAVGNWFDDPRWQSLVTLERHKLIGLTGRARSGKDTVAGMLANHYMVRTTAYADPVRAAVAGALGMPMDEYLKLEKSEVIAWVGKTRRYLEQTLGTEWGRGYVKDNVWELQVERNIDKFHEEGYDVVVTDVRFESEAKQIRDLGGVIWHIYRPGALIAESGHKSEAGVEFRADLGDIRIDNNGTLSELFEQVIDSFESM